MVPDAECVKIVKDILQAMEVGKFVIKVNHGGTLNSNMEMAVKKAEAEELPGTVKQCCCFSY